MSPRRRDREPGPTHVASLVQALRTRILSGEVAPGSPVREEEVAADYDVSRHTVRSALARLAGERLVTIAPYRGARVASLDDDELVALQELRGALETEAVRLIGQRHGVPWPDAVRRPIRDAIDRLAVADAAGDWAATTRAHADVHLAIVGAAASPRITEAYAHVESEVLLLLTHARPDYPRGTLAPEHEEYLSAVQRSGGEAVRAHLSHSADLIRAARPARPAHASR